MSDPFNALMSKLVDQIGKSVAEARTTQSEYEDRPREPGERFDMIAGTDREILSSSANEPMDVAQGDEFLPANNGDSLGLGDHGSPLRDYNLGGEEPLGNAQQPAQLNIEADMPGMNYGLQSSQPVSQTDLNADQFTSPQGEAQPLQPDERPEIDIDLPDNTLPEEQIKEIPDLAYDSITINEDTDFDFSNLIDLSGLEGQLVITVTGVPLGASFSAGTETEPGKWVFQPDDLNGLTFTPTADSDVDFQLNITVNHNDPDGNITTATQQLAVNLEAVADTPTLSYESVNSEIVLCVSADEYKGFPELQLYIDGNHVGTYNVTADHESGQWQEIRLIDDFGTNGPQSVEVKFTNDLCECSSDADRNLYVDYIAINGKTYQSEADGVVYDRYCSTIDGQEAMKWDGKLIFDTSDNPGPNTVIGYEDSAIELNIDSALTDTDGSETLSLTINGLPDGATLSAGIANHDGSWTVNADDLEGLTVTPPPDYTGIFTLTVDAISTENENGDTASTLIEIPVAIRNLNEAPTADAIPDQALPSGEPFQLDASAYFSDPDAGDHLVYEIDGPDWLSIDIYSGIIQGTPPIDVDQLQMNDNGLYELPESGVLSLGANSLSSLTCTSNSFGYYLADSEGNPLEGTLLFDNIKNLGLESHSLDLANYPDAESVGFFLLPNGANLGSNLCPGDSVSFEETETGWKIQWGDNLKTVFFSDPSLNSDDVNHLTDNSNVGNQNWEDLYGSQYGDFNDANLNVVVNVINDVTEQVEITATDSGGLSTSISFDMDIAAVDTETIVGTDNAEHLYGTASHNLIYGMDGDDTLVSQDGKDLLHGGEGTDTVEYADSLEGVTVKLRATDQYGIEDRHGNITHASEAAGGSGGDAEGDSYVSIERVIGSDHDDLVYGDAGGTYVELGRGDDRFDTVNSDSGIDTVHGGYGDDYIETGNGNDLLYGDEGNDYLISGYGDDTLVGGSGADTLKGEYDNDTLYGDSGNDTLYGGSGNDLLYGGNDNDILKGDSGNDTLTGDSGNDILYGGEGDDALHGGADDDTLSGSDGVDTLTGDDGNDTLYGGDGNDLLYGGNDNDTLKGEADNDFMMGQSGDDLLYGGDGDDSLYGGSGNDTLKGESGDDLMTGDSGDDLFYGGDGNDIFIGGADDDTAYGSSGDDMFMYTMGDGNDTYDGGDCCGWTDVIKLLSDPNGQQLGAFGDDWTLQIEEGGVLSQDNVSITLSQDTDGTIIFSDGSSISFDNIEQIEWG